MDDHFRGKARVDGNTLWIDVEFKNTFEGSVLLMALQYDWYGMLSSKNDDAPPTSKLPFAFWRAPDELLLVSGDSAPPADGIMPFAPRRPLGHRLMPGELFATSFRLPMPVQEWHAYDPPSTKATTPVTVHTLRYRLEIIRAFEASYLEEHPSFRRAWRVGGPTVQEELRLELPRPVTLSKRTDPKFKRLV